MIGSVGRRAKQRVFRGRKGSNTLEGCKRRKKTAYYKLLFYIF
jgi:hypothetical protein